MTAPATADVLPLEQGYNYAQLDRTTAQTARAAASRIRERLKRSLESIVPMGQDLLEVEKLLPYGEFGHWLHTEFAFTRRTADHFKEVASADGQLRNNFATADGADGGVQPGGHGHAG